MHKLCWMTFLLIAAWGVSSAGGAEPLKIHMISGSGEYKSEASLQVLQKELEANHEVKISASWVKDGAQDLPNVDQIPQADLLIVFARRMNLPEEQMAIIRKHWEDGKPGVGIRTASHPFSGADNETFDRKVLGGHYKGHFGGEPVKVSAVEGAEKHPVLEGVGPFVSHKLYKMGPLAESAVQLQTGTIEAKNEMHPVTWVHEYNGGRTFYTSLGVPSDFENAEFKRMIVNAIFWTTERT